MLSLDRVTTRTVGPAAAGPQVAGRGREENDVKEKRQNLELGAQT